MTLKQFIEKHHIETKHLAKVAKIGYSTLHMKIIGKRTFTPEDLLKVKRALVLINNGAISDINKITTQ